MIDQRPLLFVTSLITLFFFFSFSIFNFLRLSSAVCYVIPFLMSILERHHAVGMSTRDSHFFPCLLL